MYRQDLRIIQEMSKINKAYIVDILQSVIDFLIRDPRHYLLSNNTNKIRNLIKFVSVVTIIGSR